MEQNVICPKCHENKKRVLMDIQTSPEIIHEPEDRFPGLTQVERMIIPPEQAWACPDCGHKQSERDYGCPDESERIEALEKAVEQLRRENARR